MIKVEPGLMDSEYPLTYCRSFGYRWVVITDEHVADYHTYRYVQTLRAAGIKIDVLVIPPGEKNKSREMKSQLEDQLFALGCGRDTVLMAMGGGVILDLVGFLAATYLRGVPVIYVPTTLLAMADASIGGKTAVNTAAGKNLIGTFTMPKEVWIDIHLLETLPEREWKTGVVEMIKHALIADRALFNLFAQEKKAIFKPTSKWSDWLHQSLLIKEHIVSLDEKEQGCRAVLNFGHTVGHAIEQLDQYGLTHGEAVAIGLCVETYLSIRYAGLNPEVLSLVYNTLNQFGLPLQTQWFQWPDALLHQLTKDKKSLQGDVRCVLLKEIGLPFQEQNKYTISVPQALWREAFFWAKSVFTDRSMSQTYLN